VTAPPVAHPTGYRLIFALCAAEVLTMTGVFAFPALLPTFFTDWALTTTGAGWIAGMYFAGYALTAPILLALTDRIDARRVYLGGATLAALSSAGFALFAQGFWTALLFRVTAGMGLAATYMPGLRVLVDRYSGDHPSRAIATYTASFSLGTALSFFLAGAVESLLGWRAVFLVSAVAAAVAIAIVLALHPVPRERAPPPGFLDFRPIFRNRPAMGYILGYGVHCWELFTLRSWMVTFLAGALTRQPSPPGAVLIPTTVAALSGLVAWMASFAGNELCVRYGRRRVISRVMAGGAVLALAMGLAVPLPYAAIVVLTFAYTAVVQLDSGALTAGALSVAEADRRGATMALHALIGFGCAGVGPLAFGLILDGAGGSDRTAAWAWAFASVAVVGLLGPLALRLAGSRD
jgi:MFS family permease